MRSTVQLAQLYETPPQSRRGIVALDGETQAVDEIVVGAERGEVLEGEV